MISAKLEECEFLWEYLMELATLSETIRETSLRKSSYDMNCRQSSHWLREGLEERAFWREGIRFEVRSVIIYENLFSL